MYTILPSGPVYPRSVSFPAESPNFRKQENPLIFMLSKHFWQFTSLNLNTHKTFNNQPFSGCKQLVSSVFYLCINCQAAFS